MKLLSTLCLVAIGSSIIFSDAIAQIEASAEGNVVTLSTTVKGNQEHPSVTYIVPWRQAVAEEAVNVSFNSRSRLGDVFEHIERSEHERQVEFLVQMESAGQSAPENQ